jgi:hypothetical protein
MVITKELNSAKGFEESESEQTTFIAFDLSVYETHQQTR